MTERELIDIISWNRRILSVPPEISSSFQELLLYYPSLEDRNLANFIRQKSLQDAIKNGVPTEKELIASAIEAESWSKELETICEKADEKLAAIDASISKEKNSIRKRRLKEELDLVRQEVYELRVQRKAFILASADYMAHEQSILYLIPRLCYTTTNEKIWPSEEDFYIAKSSNPSLIGWLANEIVGEGFIDVKDIRRVARSGIWRIVWSGYRENIAGLFASSAVDLTLNQKLLMYWSRIYDSVFDDPDRPDEKIIDDDEAFDDWLANRDQERKDKKTGNSSKKQTDGHAEQFQMIDGYYIDTCTCGALKEKKGLGSCPPHIDGCRYGIYVAYSDAEKHEMAQKIHSRNNPQLRKLFAQEQERIEKSGTIAEQDLRKGATRKLLGMENKKK